MVLNWLKSRRKAKETAKTLYFAAATQARQPAFYQAMGVPDSLDGRFEMTSLHVFLLLRALKGHEDKQAKRLSQALFDYMFQVTDQAIREMGIGDLSVPRHMKRMMKAFNGRAHAYDTALAQGSNEAIEEALRRNVYGTVEQPDPAVISGMREYMRAAQENLQAADIMAGRAVFPPAGAQQGEARLYG